MKASKLTHLIYKKFSVHHDFAFKAMHLDRITTEKCHPHHLISVGSQ
jgi:hypothetical protein